MCTNLSPIVYFKRSLLTIYILWLWNYFFHHTTTLVYNPIHRCAISFPQWKWILFHRKFFPFSPSGRRYGKLSDSFQWKQSSNAASVQNLPRRMIEIQYGIPMRQLLLVGLVINIQSSAYTFTYTNEIPHFDAIKSNWSIWKHNIDFATTTHLNTFDD